VDFHETFGDWRDLIMVMSLIVNTYP
jgi:hypothetical protein